MSSFITVSKTFNQLAIRLLYVVESDKQNLYKSLPQALIYDDIIMAAALLMAFIYRRC